MFSKAICKCPRRGDNAFRLANWFVTHYFAGANNKNRRSYVKCSVCNRNWPSGARYVQTLAEAGNIISK